MSELLENITVTDDGKRKRVARWVARAQLHHALVMNVENGLMEIIDYDRTGPTFRLTDKGRRYVEQVLL